MCSKLSLGSVYIRLLDRRRLPFLLLLIMRSVVEERLTGGGDFTLPAKERDRGRSMGDSLAVLGCL